jgi:putative Mn2+ efflux pump MntP
MSLWSVILIALGLAMDALAVGLSLSLADVAVWYPSVLIGLITGAMCVLALVLGNRLRTVFSRWAEAIGGVVLIGIGLRLLLTHLR